MFIQEITNKQAWEDYLSTFSVNEKSFLHSWNWGEFQKSLDNKIWRLGIYKNEEEKKSVILASEVASDATKRVQNLKSNVLLIGVALIIKITAKRGTYLLCPHGPYLKNKIGHQLLFTYLKSLAKNESASFIRISPYLERTIENEKIYSDNGFVRSPIHTHAERTWLLNISPDEETLLKNMRKTTRYCIKKAMKEDIKLTINNEQLTNKNKHISTYLELQQETIKRHGWTPYSENYISNQVKTFSQTNEVSLITAEYNKKPIASAIVFYWQNIGFYFHGASSQEFPKLNAPYLVQWEAIREGKRRGCTLYNFWGIADHDDVPKNHPWHGITQFKIGFGGFERKLIHSYDLPVSPTYWLTHAIEKIRKWKRKL